MEDLDREQSEDCVAVSNFSSPPFYGTIDLGEMSSKLGESQTQGKQQLSPLDYMIQVFNDSSATSARRDHMALAAATYLCKMAEAGSKSARRAPKTAPSGKKDQRQERAEKASREGVFAVPQPPLRFRS